MVCLCYQIFLPTHAFVHRLALRREKLLTFGGKYEFLSVVTSKIVCRI